MSRPTPPIEEHVDLSDYGWFPLHYKRLQQSEWWVAASDLARSRNVDLWCAAYEQVPAASLPDNDVELAKFAGYGRDVAGFRAVKDEIMGAWVLCSDGRWYHPTLCEVAAEAWAKMSEKRRSDRERKARSRKGIKERLKGPVTRDDTPSSHVTDTAVTRDTAPVDLLSQVTPPDVTADPPLQTERKGHYSAGSGEPTASAPKPKKTMTGAEDPEFMEFWNLAPPKMRERSSTRETHKEWVKERRTYTGQQIIAALRRFIAEGDRPKGGQGLHTWLKEGKHETWMPKEPSGYSEERWRTILELYRSGEPWTDTLGPEPGQPGCRVPAHLLVTPVERVA